jgi:hypothetical protein
MSIHSKLLFIGKRFQNRNNKFYFILTYLNDQKTNNHHLSKYCKTIILDINHTKNLRIYFILYRKKNDNYWESFDDIDNKEKQTISSVQYRNMQRYPILFYKIR